MPEARNPEAGGGRRVYRVEFKYADPVLVAARSEGEALALARRLQARLPAERRQEPWKARPVL